MLISYDSYVTVITRGHMFILTFGDPFGMGWGPGYVTAPEILVNQGVGWIPRSNGDIFGTAMYIYMHYDLDVRLYKHTAFTYTHNSVQHTILVPFLHMECCKSWKHTAWHDLPGTNCHLNATMIVNHSTIGNCGALSWEKPKLVCKLKLHRRIGSQWFSATLISPRRSGMFGRPWFPIHMQYPLISGSKKMDKIG